MKKLFMFLCAVTFLFAIAGMAHAELILSEDFENSSGFTTGGGWAAYWGVAPLSGTALIPSQFVQGGNQNGMIFYGSFAREYGGAPAATMTIGLPDLSGYTNLQLTVSLAAPEMIWEDSQRDSLHIIGGTAISPPLVECNAAGCLPVPGAIDSFLPYPRPGSLRSQMYSNDLTLVFQDYGYTIDGSLKSLTFAFASTDYPEMVGIDSVRITGDPIAPVPEPSTMLLLGSGLIGILGFRKRLRKS
jgi:hypothetical protein